MRVLIGLILFLVTGCSMPQADPERVAQSRQVYEWVRDGDTEALAAASTETLRPRLDGQILAAMKSYTVPGEPTSSRVTSWRSSLATNGPATYAIVQQFHYAERHVIVSVVMVRSRNESRWLIDGVHLNAIDPTVARAAGGFTLQGKSPLHYAVLAGVVAAPIICLVTAGFAAWRRRWAWLVFSLFGFGQFALNWNSGEWQFNVLHFSVLSAGFLKGLGPMDPWILMVSIPIPAILFWALGRHRPKPPKPPKSAPESDAASQV